MDINNYSSMKDLNITKDDITLKMDNNTLSLKTPIYIDKNRYYLCLNDIVDNLDGTLSISDSILEISLLDKDIDINADNNKININSKEFNLKEDIIKNDSFYYISFLIFLTY